MRACIGTSLLAGILPVVQVALLPVVQVAILPVVQVALLLPVALLRQRGFLQVSRHRPVVHRGGSG